jgi:aromatic ring-opening dioxygenase LigB subunit
LLPYGERLKKLCDSDAYSQLLFFSGSDYSELPIRWSVVVPAHFIEKHLADLNTVVGPQWIILSSPLVPFARDWRERMKDAGRDLLAWIENGTERVFVLVSGDLSHHHDWHPELFEGHYHQSLNLEKCKHMAETTKLFPHLATKLDDAILEWATTLDEAQLDAAFEENAKLHSACGIFGFYFLHGLLDRLQWEMKRLLDDEMTVYAHPTYYGMMVAHWNVLGIKETIDV